MPLQPAKTIRISQNRNPMRQLRCFFLTRRHHYFPLPAIVSHLYKAEYNRLLVFHLLPIFWRFVFIDTQKEVMMFREKPHTATPAKHPE